MDKYCGQCGGNSTSGHDATCTNYQKNEREERAYQLDSKEERAKLHSEQVSNALISAFTTTIPGSYEPNKSIIAYFLFENF
jgi:hypothetical protein